MKRDAGQTLIELIVFIVVIGIVVAGSMRAFQTVLLNSSKPAYILTAGQLADARMNLIILQRHVTGFTNLTDPCSSGSLAACADLIAFANAHDYVVESEILPITTGTRTATVTVSGKSHAKVIVSFAE